MNYPLFSSMSPCCQFYSLVHLVQYWHFECTISCAEFLASRQPEKGKQLKIQPDRQTEGRQNTWTIPERETKGGDRWLVPENEFLKWKFLLDRSELHFPFLFIYLWTQKTQQSVSSTLDISISTFYTSTALYMHTCQPEVPLNKYQYTSTIKLKVLPNFSKSCDLQEIIK